MQLGNYSYEECLDGSVRSSWNLEDCFQGRDFDFSKSFLPDKMAGVEELEFLNEEEKRTLNQIRGNSYCHLFIFVEEFIIPHVLEHAQHGVFGDEKRLWSLLRFGEEEVKHQAMLARAMEQFEKGFGRSCGVIPDREGVAQVVLGKSQFAVLLLTTLLEWMTQFHYTEHVRDADLDELFRDILRFHWMDESRHAKIDTMLVGEVADTISLEEREKAIDELLELGTAIDGLLSQQIELDIESLEKATGRTFSDEEKQEIRGKQQRAYRWTFLVSGLEHPKFVKIVQEITEQGSQKLTAAIEALSA